MKNFFQGVKGFFQKIGSWCKNHKTLVALIVTVLFTASQIPFLVNHEIWNDEAVPWELSKQVNLGNIYELNSAEPHPLLWELLLAPFSQNNFPVITINILSLIIISLAVFLFLRFCPTNPVIKLIFLLSSVFFYYNPVVARSYCLIPLAIAFIGITYKKRHERPFLYGLALAFLSQTHFLVYGLLAVLLLGFIIEEIKSKNSAGKTILNIIKASAPTVLSVLSVLPLVFASSKNQLIMNGQDPYFSPSRFFPTFQYIIYGIDELALDIAMIVVSVLLIISLFAENVKVALYTVAGIGFWFFTMLVVYPGYFFFYQKCSILFMIVLMSVWLLSLEPKNKKENIVAKFFNFSEIAKILKRRVRNPAIVLVAILIVATVPETLIMAFTDLSTPFSSSKKNADFVNSLPENSIIVENDFAAWFQFGPEVRAQTTNKNVTYYNLPLDSYTNYGRSLKYDNEHMDETNSMFELGYEEVNKKLNEFSEKYDHVYYLTSSGRVACTNYEPQIPEWLKSYELVTELDNGTYIAPGHNPTLVFKIK